MGKGERSMTAEEWTMIASELREVYSDSKVLTTKEAMAVWFRHLKDLPGKTVRAVVDKYIETDTSGFPPKIADIRTLAAEAVIGEEDTPKEAWTKAYKAICRMDWNNPAEEYNKLPEAIKKAMSLEEMISWGQMDDHEVQTVIASKFQSSYKTVSERQRQTAIMSGNTVQALATATVERLEAKDA